MEAPFHRLDRTKKLYAQRVICQKFNLVLSSLPTSNKNTNTIYSYDELTVPRSIFFSSTDQSPYNV